MLSPGTRWKDKLSLSEKEVLDWRAWWLRRGQANRRVREGLREACKHDLLLYVNLFVWQFNPRQLGSEVGPFTTWPFQDEDFLFVLKTLEDQVNLVCEKSREMGFSWKFLLIMDWMARFHRNKKFLAISRNESAVEDDDPDSLFWKLDFVHSHLPEWLHQPEKFNRRKLFFGYPGGSTITGTASTGRAGVGGRATAILVDEFSQIKEDWQVLHRTSDTAYCRWFNGTHVGVGSCFYALCTDRVSFPPSRWRRLVRHWSEHPQKRNGLYRYDQTKNAIEVLDKSYDFPPEFEFRRTPAPVGGPFPGIRSPWYDSACDDKGNNSRAIAEDLDINPKGAVSQVFDPLRVTHLIREHCVPPYWEGDVVLQDGKIKHLEQKPNGPLKLWTLLRHDRPKPSKYCVGCDLSSGNGATNSCASFLDARLAEKVASYTTPFLKPEDLAPVIVALCHWFENEEGDGARLAWEMPGPGLNFSEVVLKLGYRNVYLKAQSDKTGPKIIDREIPDSPGWWNNGTAKRWLVDRYRAAVENGRYVTREKEELEECLDFKWTKDGSSVEHSAEGSTEDPSGARGNHGDRVIASALAWMLGAGEADAKGREEEKPDEPPPGSLAWRRALRDNPEREWGDADPDGGRDWL